MKNLTGQKFGRLTAIEMTNKRVRHGSVVWKCICDCGGYKEVGSSQLIKGMVRSCGCLRRENGIRLGTSGLKDLTGQRFGLLTVICRVTGSRRRLTLWLCKCDCGNEKVVDRSSLLSGNVKTCSDRKCTAKIKNINFNPYEKRVRQGYVALNSVAKRKNYRMEITAEQFKDLLYKDCYYCGSKFQDSPKGFSYRLDRLDSSKGYTMDNVVPCCTICNRAKSTLSVEEFQNWIRGIVERFYADNTIGL